MIYAICYVGITILVALLMGQLIHFGMGDDDDSDRRL